MKNKLNKKNLIVAIFIIFFIIAIITLSQTIFKNNIQLIGLSPQGPRQMMGYIIRTKNDKTIIIDGGTIDDTANLMKYIGKYNNKVDYWFITHAHDDHVGAFTEIANNTDVQIDNIYISLNEYEWYEQNEPSRAEFSKKVIDTVNSEKRKENVHIPQINEKIQIDGIEVEILGIRNPEITENSGNEQSMVIKFNTGKQSLLILGDTGEKSSEKLLNTQKDKLKSDIVQMAHHGQAGATKELYEAVQPKICLWPTPEWLWNNDAGNGKGTGTWKTLETRKWMEDLNVETNYVAKDGDYIINLK